MSRVRSAAVYRQIDALWRVGATADLGDGELLGRFADRRDEGAFAALVGRHAPMVARVCRGILGDEHSAQDASQAVFLILAMRAETVRRRGSAASWLHGVARRVATKARRSAARREVHERRSGTLEARRQRPAEAVEGYAELVAAIDGLPEAFRHVIVLCDLEGLTQAQAAARLGCPLGTVQSRLARGRQKLRSRLIGGAAGLCGKAAGASTVTPGWVQATARASLRYTDAGVATAAGASPAAKHLAGEFLGAMTMTRGKLAAGLLLAMAAAGLSSGIKARSNLIDPETKAAPAKADPVKLHGQVVGPRGEAVAGAKLTLVTVEAREREPKTDAAGEFAMTVDKLDHEFALKVEAGGMAPRVFILEKPQAPRLPSTPPIIAPGPMKPSYRVMADGEIRPSLVVSPGAAVVGRVVRDGRPIAGLKLGIAVVDRYLNLQEVTTESDGRFRLEHASAGDELRVVPMGDGLKGVGAMTPVVATAGGDGTTVDLGDIRVKPGRSIAGRVVFADGKAPPANAQVMVSPKGFVESLNSRLGAEGRFAVGDIPDGEVSVCVLFPDDQFYAPKGYKLSARNGSKDPVTSWQLVGRLVADAKDMTILFEPGEEAPFNTAPDSWARHEKAVREPLTGAPSGK